MKTGVALPEVAKENVSARAAIRCAGDRKAAAQNEGGKPTGLCLTEVRTSGPQGDVLTKATLNSLGEALQTICHRID